MYTIEVKDDCLYISDTNGVYSCGHKIELNKLSFLQKVQLKHIFDSLYFGEYTND